MRRDNNQGYQQPQRREPDDDSLDVQTAFARVRASGGPVVTIIICLLCLFIVWMIVRDHEAKASERSGISASEMKKVIARQEALIDAVTEQSWLSTQTQRRREQIGESLIMPESLRTKLLKGSRRDDNGHQ